MQVGAAWKAVNRFVKEHKRRFQLPEFPARFSSHYDLYLWATTVVAAYSFELGDAKFQVRHILI